MQWVEKDEMIDLDLSKVDEWFVYQIELTQLKSKNMQRIEKDEMITISIPIVFSLYLDYCMERAYAE